MKLQKDQYLAARAVFQATIWVAAFGFYSLRCIFSGCQQPCGFSFLQVDVTPIAKGCVFGAIHHLSLTL